MSKYPKQKSVFHAEEWLHYFEENALQRPLILWDHGIVVETQQRRPLLRSLQRFQVGEQGDGRHLLEAVARTQNPEYQAAMALFIKEEQEHSRMLAKIIKGMGGNLLTSHWSDTCFVLLRRLLGLRMELLILLIAEVIAQVYYKALFDGTTDIVLRSVFGQILHDEDGHVAFHCAYLHQTFSKLSPLVRWLISNSWNLLFRLVCGIVIWDHHTALRAVGMTPSICWHECMQAYATARQSCFRPTLKGHSVELANQA
ncbi:ferritin-like domain-containing protein [Ktedonospora formicarum]|uniref:Membrane protein n=1 Tax=Ktedonospora formicarum TaxID=2778364 RepID=A0A8J3HRD5_9CHLR|nr:ferritin-like domain-containing protein [Ktedonospora formicarum]GHO41916.1 membrane protein [Ktedonospora formicarum]